MEKSQETKGYEIIKIAALTFTLIVLSLLFVGLIIIVLPLAVIWALNTLFPALLIPYAFKTWGAMTILLFTLGLSLTPVRGYCKYNCRYEEDCNSFCRSSQEENDE